MTQGPYVDVLTAMKELLLRSPTLGARLSEAGVEVPDHGSRIYFCQNEDDDQDEATLDKPFIVLDVLDSSWVLLDDQRLWPNQTVGMVILDDSQSADSNNSWQTFMEMVGRIVEEVCDSQLWKLRIPHLTSVVQQQPAMRTKSRERTENYDYWKIAFRLEVSPNE